MKNFWYRLRFLWFAYLTNYFYQDHYLLGTTNPTLLDEKFPDNKYTYTWDRPSWSTWNNIIFKNSQVKLINNEVIMTTDHNNVPNEPAIMSGEITSANFLNRTYGYYEVNMKPCGSWDATWLFQSANIPVGMEHFEIDFSEFECDTDSAFTCTIWTYGIDGKGINGKTSEIIASKRFQAKKNLTNNYHIFGCDWQSGYVAIYLDNKLLWKYTGKKIPNTNMFLWANNSYKGGSLPSSNSTRALRVSENKY
jgi:beta-glucanase (GH16 family)